MYISLWLVAQIDLAKPLFILWDILLLFMTLSTRALGHAAMTSKPPPPPPPSNSQLDLEQNEGEVAFGDDHGIQQH